ncbi:DUF3761 domain-containing protein [Dyella monticola]|uniref:DUF3761 domain-containing protein n=1 Tax=Dyella monticola TaxID=1927958 RepID=A0A370WSV1_9GAMM|nr:DUF3761 domain-containing protein [Dyella monticola]
MPIRICLFLALAFGLSTPASAQEAQATPPPPPTQRVTNGSTQLIEPGNYVNRDGLLVHRPAHTVSGTAPSGASAQCRDGSYSFSLHHRGTCSRHGGVLRWLN